jgi:beta-galactosidase
MSIISTQYYRPPFPENKYWSDDLKLIKDTGFDCIQLWAVWSWIEPEPGKFIFDDYEKLFELAEKNGLKVIISTIAELHPFWIHRIVPDSYMVTQKGHKVISSLRSESNTGLTPGGCFDNPKVLELMGKFLDTTARRFKDFANLLAWDCWNELRWHRLADDYVCYCDHTVNNYRSWLKKKYGSLEGLNEIWKRRYCSWDDVFPSKHPWRPYTDHIEFCSFLTDRAQEHTKFRADTIRNIDDKHIISAHSAKPCIRPGLPDYEQPLSRGNDWNLSRHLDTYGTSCFPFGDGEQIGINDRHFLYTMKAGYSSAGPKPFWLSEFQGGPVRFGPAIMPAVEADRQQRYLWMAIGTGVKLINIWTWRDEVFSMESEGYGLAGNDGQARDRLKAFELTSRVLRQNKEIFESCRPTRAMVGLIFNPDNYFLTWARDENIDSIAKNIQGYGTALENVCINYSIIESNNFENLNDYKVVILTSSLIVGQELREKIIRFVEMGGTLIVESETDSFTRSGFYNYPQQRPLLKAFGLEEIGKRKLKTSEVKVTIHNNIFNIILPEWINPIKPVSGEIKDLSQESIFVQKKHKEGQIIVLPNSLGCIYDSKPYRDFENMMKNLCGLAKIKPLIESNKEESDLFARVADSNDCKLLFISSPNFKGKMNIKTTMTGYRKVEDLFNKTAVNLTADEELPIKLDFSERSYAVLKFSN